MCQVPDYRKVAPQAHADLVATIYRQLMRQDGRLDDWFSRQVAEVDRTDGDIDTLSARIAQVPHMDLRGEPAGLARVILSIGRASPVR